MASWRVKGYVSDSDSEDGAVDIDQIMFTDETTTHPPAALAVLGSDQSEVAISGRETIRGNRIDTTISQDNTSRSLSTADKLQQCLQQASQIVRSISPRLTGPENGILPQDEDSPLSSPPDSPQSLPTADKVLSGEGKFQMVNQPILTQAPSRNLRQRTANQLQPYTIDRAKHIQEWSALGIKPVSLPRGRSPILGVGKPSTEDSQFEDSPSNVVESNSQDLMDLDDLSQSPQPIRRDIYDLDMEDDLPDLARLLQRRSPHSTNRLIRTAISFDVSSSDSEVPLQPRRRKLSTQTLDQQDSLPSPPPSLDAKLTKSLGPIENQDQNISRSTLLASTPRPRKRLVVEDDTQSAGEERVSTPIPVVHIQDDSSTDDEASEYGMVQAMQKRIKGVLPASWWTVEMAQKSLAAKKKKISRQHPSRTPHAGIAQRRVNSHNQPRVDLDHDLEALLSDDESSDIAAPATSATPRTVLNGRPMNQEPLEDADDTDIAEENEIDPMLAPQHRRKLSYTESRARTDTSEKHKTHHQPRQRPGKSSSGPNSASTRYRKRVKAKSTKGRVHVLDAPDFQLPKRSLPPFLRVAARQAKSKSRFSGTLSSRKFIRLNSDDDSSEPGLNRSSESAVHNSRHSLPKINGHRESAKPKPSTSTYRADHRKSSTNHQDLPSLPNTVDTGNRAGTLGQLVQCGPSDDATLRLTRLQSLLPLTNRSGNGSFAAQRPRPRNAQMEVLQPALRPFTRNKPRNNALSSAVPVLRDGITEAKQTNDQHEQAKATKTSLRRFRKQVPVQRAKLRQTSLITPSPNTKGLTALIGRGDPFVRDTLEKEFNTHQAAWFQASRQDIVYSNQETQQHFYTFLDVLKSYLPLALQDAEDDRESRELRSFIHRLIPNRGQIGASGQVGNKTRSVHQYDILVAQNVFELHKCLLSLAPGAAPRPRALEMKVNFADAHEEICLIALSTWKAIYQMHIVGADIVHGLASWLYSMLLQLANRWSAAEIDAQKDAANSASLINPDIVRRVVVHNQDRACSLFREVLTNFTECLKEATSATEARSLFSVGDFVEVLSRLNNLEKLDATIIESLFATAATYVTRPWKSAEKAELAKILDALRRAFIVSTKGRVLPYAMAYSMTTSFFTVVKIGVDQCQTSWDTLLISAAPHSLDSELGTDNLQLVKCLFFHLLIERDTMQYMMEFRSTVISFWVLMLLEIREQDQHCKLLTRSLFQHEELSLGMSELASKFGRLDNIDDGSFSEVSMSELRHAVVLHVIAVLHGQENSAEANWVPSGFEEGDAKMLLGSMFTDMRKTWISLRDNPDEQDVYTVLIHAALRQFEIYPRKDVNIDSWFYNSATFPQPMRNNLFQILSGADIPGNELVEKAKDLFDREVEQASRFDGLEALEEKLKNTVIKRNWLDFDAGGVSVLTEHGKFFQMVLTNQMSKASADSKLAARLLVRVLVHLMNNLHCHPEVEDPHAIKGFVLSMLPLLSVLRGDLSESSILSRDYVFELVTQIYNWTIACLHDIPDSITSDMEAICEIASQDDTTQSLVLLEAVMTMGQTKTA